MVGGGGGVERHFSVPLWAKSWAEYGSLGPSWTISLIYEKINFIDRVPLRYLWNFLKHPWNTLKKSSKLPWNYETNKLSGNFLFNYLPVVFIERPPPLKIQVWSVNSNISQSQYLDQNLESGHFSQLIEQSVDKSSKQALKDIQPESQSILDQSKNIFRPESQKFSYPSFKNVQTKVLQVKCIIDVLTKTGQCSYG